MTLRRLKAACVMAAVATVTLTGIGTASAAPHTAFATQAKDAGLSAAQDARLQHRVEQILHQYHGARQVAANEIALPHGDSVLLPLPGQKYAHVLPGAVNLGFGTSAGTDAVRPAETGTVDEVGVPFYWFVNGDPDDGLGASCSYDYLCMWQGQWGAGEQFNVSTCNEDQELPGSGWNTDGSFVNNQTPGTEAFLLNSSRGLVYTVPTEYYNSDYDWAPIWYANACDH